jgi:parallel beta-helix repeat protein
MESDMARVIPRTKTLVASFAVLFATLFSGSPLYAAASNAAPAGSGVASCVGDGVTDDTDCLQRAVPAQGQLALPAGKTFLISRSIIISDSTTLDGNGSTITATTPIQMIRLRGDGAKVQNLTLTSTGPKGAQGIAIDPSASNVAIVNNVIKGNFLFAIIFGSINQHDIVIDHNTIQPAPNGLMNYGILVNPPALMRGVGAPPRKITIKNNTITDVSSDAIEINSPSHQAGQDRAASDIVITNNVLSAPNHKATVYSGFCIGLAGTQNVQVTGNRIFDCKWQGIHVEDGSSNVTIVNNTISHVIGPVPPETTWGRNSSGILLINSSDVRIFGNTIDRAHNAGIDLVWNRIGTNQNVSIAGNVVKRSGDFGIRVSGPPMWDKNIAVGATAGYGANQVTGSQTADYSSCTVVRGSESKKMACSPF